MSTPRTSRRGRASVTIVLVVGVGLAACSSHSSTRSAASTTTVSKYSAPTVVVASASGDRRTVSDPCALLTAADAQDLLGASAAPTPQRGDAPTPSCRYGGPDGTSSVEVEVQPSAPSGPTLGIDGATPLTGLGDAAAISVDPPSILVAWVAGGLGYRLSWTSSTDATTARIVNLAHFVAGRV
jgi:hypothetical protein